MARDAWTAPTPATPVPRGFVPHAVATHAPASPLLALAPAVLDHVNAQLEALHPREIIRWAVRTLPNVIQTTAFGLTGAFAAWENRCGGEQTTVGSQEKSSKVPLNLAERPADHSETVLGPAFGSPSSSLRRNLDWSIQEVTATNPISFLIPLPNPLLSSLLSLSSSPSLFLFFPPFFFFFFFLSPSRNGRFAHDQPRA
jgi:hypothetical protein